MIIDLLGLGPLSTPCVGLLRRTLQQAARRAATVSVLIAGLLAAGCAGLPQVDRNAIATTAIPGSTDTTLGRIAERSRPSPELTGFRVMPMGTFSLDTRLELAARAERTLDIQYYHVASDETGRYFLRMLRDAARHGVRVRLLIDDLYTTGEDELLLGFAAHPNVQLRVFNPFVRGRDFGQLGRFVVAPGQWGRLNHRMHNKLVIADGAMAVLGGRNIANEYFLRGPTQNFVDMDLFTVGAIVPHLARVFDSFWNSDAVYPIESITSSPLPAQALRDYFDRATDPSVTPGPDPLPPNDVLGYGPVSEDLDAGRLGLIWGTASVIADIPLKVQASAEELKMSGVTYNVLAAMRTARREVLVSSPYLVPGERGMALIRDLRGRGVKVSVLTNSLASTDEPLVHIGYSRYRPEMVDLGVAVHELSSSRLGRNPRQPRLFGKSLGRLHAKLVVIDKERLFIGSMNLDPRSQSTNTEIGLLIDSPQLAREVSRVIDIDKLQSAYKVTRGPAGNLRWIAMDSDEETSVDTEPDSTFGLRLRTILLAPLVPESLL